jgi:hypothetical protein
VRDSLFIYYTSTLGIKGETSVQEAKDSKSTVNAGSDQGAESKDPKSDATSSETLSDLEEKEKVSGTKSQGEGSSGSGTAPSPDGAFDEGSSRGPREDPGPM